MRGDNWKDLWHQLCFAKGRLKVAPRKWLQKELESVWELLPLCSQIVFKSLYFSRIGRPDILLSVNKLARAVTKWSQACDRRLARLISYIHHTGDYRQDCRVGNTVQHCRLGLFQDSDFAGDLEDSKSKSTSGGVLCIFGSRIFVTISWMCKKTNVSIPQFYRIWNHFFGWWIAHGWVTWCRSLGHCD